MGEGGRLGPLEVGVAGHDGVQVALGLAEKGFLQVQQHPHNDGNLFLDKEAEVQGHLVIPAAGGVQPLARVPDALGEDGLDIHVDILVLQGELHLSGPQCRPGWP